MWSQDTCSYQISKFENSFQTAESTCRNYWRIQGGRQGRPQPPESKFFHFHAVFSKNLKNNSNFGSWRTPLGKILDPPLEASTIFWPNFGKRPQTFWALNPLMVKKPSINWTGTHRGRSRISKGGRQPRVKRLLADFYKQECIPVGCVPSSAVAVCWGRGSAPGGVCSRGVCVPGGVCSRWGWYPSMHWGRPPCGQTGVKT